MENTTMMNKHCRLSGNEAVDYRTNYHHAVAQQILQLQQLMTTASVQPRWWIDMFSVPISCLRRKWFPELISWFFEVERGMRRVSFSDCRRLDHDIPPTPEILINNDNYMKRKFTRMKCRWWAQDSLWNDVKGYSFPLTPFSLSMKKLWK